jgi:thioredoxin-like negative regulator of GroEL
VVSSDPASAADPVNVHALAELAEAFQRLRGSLSYADLDRAVNPDRSGKGPRVLPPATLNNLLHGRSVPRRETVETFLTACGLDPAARKPWLAAWERVNTAHLHRPAEAVRVRQARPRLLGVHAAIRLGSGGDPDDLPPFVPRDVDGDLRAAITAVAERGGLVLLVGGSSVGKTRVLYETVLAALPEWWLIHPADAAAVRDLAARPSPRTVIWLDELQRYLDGPGGVPVAAARALIAAGAAIVATMWPTEYHVRTLDPKPGEPDRYGNDRELIRLAHVLSVAEDFSSAERRRAQALADDRRIRAALDTQDAGFTQILAAGPDLIRHWVQAPPDQCYGQAVITAALDARRIGTTAPLSRKFLEAAAPGYLTGRQQADAPADWLDRALAYACSPLRGATAALCPTSAGMGEVAGYVPADYLYQHAQQTRRTAHLPDSAWRALVDFHHPDDAIRLAAGARSRGRLHEAEAFYRCGAAEGAANAVQELAALLTDQGRFDDAVTLLRQYADAGDRYAADRLTAVLTGQGRVDEAITLLSRRVEAGDELADDRLNHLLAEHNRIDELQQRADAGNELAAYRLAYLLADQGRVDDAVALLRRRADAGDTFADDELIELLVDVGHVNDAIARLRRRVDAGDTYLAQRLIELLAEHGRVDDLRHHAGAGDGTAARRLAGLLAQHGRVNEAVTLLRQLADIDDYGGHILATDQLAALLAEHGRTDEATTALRRLADRGDTTAARKLSRLLADDGRIDDAVTVLRQAAEYDDENLVADELTALLAAHGRIDDLRQQADAGDTTAADRLARVLGEQGRVDDLRRRADAGDRSAAYELAIQLARRDQVDDALALLRQHADDGDALAARMLAGMLAAHHRVDEAVAVLRLRAAAGDPLAEAALIDILGKYGRADELAEEVAAGTWGAAAALEALRRDTT